MLDNFSQVIPFWQENVVKISRKKWKKFLDVKNKNKHIGKIKIRKIKIYEELIKKIRNLK